MPRGDLPPHMQVDPAPSLLSALCPKRRFPAVAGLAIIGLGIHVAYGVAYLARVGRAVHRSGSRGSRGSRGSSVHIPPTQLSPPPQLPPSSGEGSGESPEESHQEPFPEERVCPPADEALLVLHAVRCLSLAAVAVSRSGDVSLNALTILSLSHLAHIVLAHHVEDRAAKQRSPAPKIDSITEIVSSLLLIVSVALLHSASNARGVAFIVSAGNAVFLLFCLHKAVRSELTLWGKPQCSRGSEINRRLEFMLSEV